jgi:hypothetical protein
LVPELNNTVFAGPNIAGLDKVFPSSSANATTLAITGTPFASGEWGLFIAVATHLQGTQLSAGAGWTSLNTLIPDGIVAGQLFSSGGAVTVSTPIAPNGYSAMLTFFQVAVPGVAPTIVNQATTSNLITNASGSYTNTAGNKILVAILNSDTTQDVPISSVGISDTNGNTYVPLALLFNASPNVTQLFVYMADNINAGSNTTTVNLGHRIRGQVFFAEINGVGTSGTGQPAFRVLIPGDIPNLSASKITSGKLALARGGTNADLSGTGGGSQVLKQTSAGAGITVGQLAASDLSNGVTGSGAVVLAASPALTGSPTAPTQANSDNSTKLATTSYVNNVAPIIVAKSSLTGKSAALTATTIYAVPSTGAGLYRVSWRASVTTAGSVSSSLGGTNGFQVSYTDLNDSVVKTSNPTTPTVSAGNTTATTISGVAYANCKSSTNLQYLFDYTANAAASMVYDLDIYVEYLG